MAHGTWHGRNLHHKAAARAVSFLFYGSVSFSGFVIVLALFSACQHNHNHNHNHNNNYKKTARRSTALAVLHKMEELGVWHRLECLLHWAEVWFLIKRNRNRKEKGESSCGAFVRNLVWGGSVSGSPAVDTSYFPDKGGSSPNKGNESDRCHHKIGKWIYI